MIDTYLFYLGGYRTNMIIITGGICDLFSGVVVVCPRAWKTGKLPDTPKLPDIPKVIIDTKRQ